MRYTKIKTANSPMNIVQLPRLGKIRLGIKKISQGGKEYPAEVDYFVLPREVQAVFGERPMSLDVMIPVEDQELFYRSYYAVYGGNQKLKCQGDGETAERRTEKGIEKMQCPSPDGCDFAKANGCKARADLMVVIPAVNCGGVYQLSTGSVNSVIDINSGLEMARHLFGRVSWVPMRITREGMKIADPNTGKMNTHYPVKLYPVANVQEANQIREDTKRIIERIKNFALPEPVQEGPEEEPIPTEMAADAPPAALAAPVEPPKEAQGKSDYPRITADQWNRITRAYKKAGKPSTQVSRFLAAYKNDLTPNGIQHGSEIPQEYYDDIFAWASSESTTMKGGSADA